MDTVLIDTSAPLHRNSEVQNHIESLRTTKSKLLALYAQAKTDLLEQIADVDIEINSTLPSMSEVQCKIPPLQTPV